MFLLNPGEFTCNVDKYPVCTVLLYLISSGGYETKLILETKRLYSTF